MDAPVEEALAAEETAAPAAQEAAAPQTAAARIATNVGVVPAGIDWADNVTANTFAEPYATVTAKDKAGYEYTVEVIPAFRSPRSSPATPFTLSTAWPLPATTRWTMFSPLPPTQPPRRCWATSC